VVDRTLRSTRAPCLHRSHPRDHLLCTTREKVRSSTWQGFETLTASKCGQYGTLLLGIDKDTKTGFLYAVGRANGSSTAIKGLGQVSTTFPDPVDLRWSPPSFADNLNGE